MKIYLDESGDLGFDFNPKGSSSHLVITLLVCNDRRTDLSFASAVKHTIKRKLKQQNELKGYLTTLAVKKYFLNNLLKKFDQAWSVFSIIMDKQTALPKLSYPVNKNRIYNVLTHRVLSFIDFQEINEHIHLIVDRCKSSKERETFNSYLQSNLEARLPIDRKLDITHGLSHDYAGLQAVDMFCYGIARKYAYSDTDRYDLFKHKVVCEEIF